MDPLGIAAAGVSLGGDALSAWLGHEEAQNAQAFAERMASTQYQRTVTDLKAAGLNPMLAYMNTNASPSSAVAAVPHIGSGAASSFSSVHSAKASAALADAQAQLPKEQIKLMREQALQAYSQTQLNTAQDILKQKEWNLVDAEVKRTNAEARSAEAEAAFNEMMMGAAKALGPAGAFAGKLLDVLPIGKGRGAPFPRRGK